MKVWDRLDDGTDVQDIGFKTIVTKRFRMNDGTTMRADISGSEGAQATIVIPITIDNKVVIARQFRCGPEKVMEELPGGSVDPGETPEQSAARELKEEVGYEAERLEYIGMAYVNAWDSTVHHYYLGHNCKKVHDGEPEKFEEIEVDTISIDALVQNAKSGNMTDAQAVLLAYDILQEMKEES